MKILNLVLYSPNNHYDQMKTILLDYYKNHRLTKDNSVKTIFYWSDPNLDTNFKVISDDAVIIKGNETMIPGILQKTMIAMKWACENFQFDFLMRSSVSTLVDLDELFEFLSKNPLHYGGHLQLNVHIQAWVDPDIGIVDQTKLEVPYSQGTSIVFSRPVVDTLTKDINKMNYSLQDDVSFGWKMMELKVPFTRLTQKSNLSSLEKGVIFYRNKTKEDRDKDVTNIKNLSDLLTKRGGEGFHLTFSESLGQSVVQL